MHGPLEDTTGTTAWDRGRPDKTRHDMATRGWIAWAAGLSVAALGHELRTTRRQAEAEVNRCWLELEKRARAQTPERPFHRDMVWDLPDAAERYLRHAIREGAALPRAARLDVAGAFQLGSKWLPFVGSELLVPPHGFVWRATTGAKQAGRRWVEGHLDDFAHAQVWLHRTIPVLHEESTPDLVKWAADRLLVDALWCPAVLLPQFGARWDAVDDRRVAVRIPVQDDAASLVLTVAPDGRLEAFQLLRWGNPYSPDVWGRYVYGGEIETERTFGDYTVPARYRAGWAPGTRSFMLAFQPRVVRASYFGP